MLQVRSPQTLLHESREHVFKSFEQLRKAGAAKFSSLTIGMVGRLSVKGDNYRILTEQDFQRLVGAMATSELLQNQLKMVVHVAITYVKHEDDSTREALRSAITTVIESPGISRADGHDDPSFEGFDADEEEYVFDAEELRQQVLGR